MNNARKLSDFLFYVINSFQSSLEYARDEALKMMRINLEVKKVMAYLIIEVEKTLKQKK